MPADAGISTPFCAGQMVTLSSVVVKFNNWALNCTLYSPVFVDVVISSFFTKVGIAQQFNASNSTLAFKELAINIDLADIVKVQRSHVLTWSEANQSITQQVCVSF